jgi:hypothetical protein
MSMAEPIVERTSIRYVQWGPIVAGALAAAALSFVLHSFAAAIGVSVSSTAPTWRDASFALMLLSGVYLVLVALAAYALGGYIAGRLRERLTIGDPDEVEFRDGTHGLAVWALATLLTVLLAVAASSIASRLTTPSSGTSGPSASVGSENIIAFDLDKLFRSDRPQQGNIEYARAEAGRILLTAPSHRGVQPDDRSYLIRLVAGRTGLAEPDATRRVDAAIASVRDNIRRARSSAAILAFMVGAAALLGAAAAWFAACAGGRHRDSGVAPAWMWRTTTSVGRPF